jgi:hypothetical protein
MFTGPEANLGVTLAPCDPTGPTTYSIVLDTTTSSSWKASFYEDGARVNGPNTYSDGVPAINGVFIENYDGPGNTWSNFLLTDSVLPNESPVFLPNVPATDFVMPGGTMSLSCGASDIGSLPITYQWQFNGTNLTNSSLISGAQSASLTISNFETNQAGSYQVIATDSSGSTTSGVCAVTLGALPVTFSGVDGQAWTGDSLSGTFNNNNPLASNLLTLTDTDTSGGGQVREFWFNFPQNIGGAFQASFVYQATGSALGDGASFCIQNDSRGLAADTGAGNTLGVDGQGITPNVSPSVELAFYLYPYGPQSSTGYSWSTNGSLNAPASTGSVNLLSQDPIAVSLNYTNDQLTLTMEDTVTAATFNTNIAVGSISTLLGTNMAYVGFTGSDSTTTPTLQTITNFTYVPYSQSPLALSYTAAQNVYAGNTAQFSVVPLAGSIPIHWYFVSGGATNVLSDGGNISGSQTGALTISNVSSSVTGYYQCVITNSIGSILSPLAPLTLVTATGSVINGPGDSLSDFNNPTGSPTGAGVAEVADGTLASYINYGLSGGPGNAFAGPAGFIDTPAAGVSIINAMRVYEGTSYASEPANYAIYGGPGPAGPWTLIVGGSLPTYMAQNPATGQMDSTNEVMAEVDFANTNAYTSYAVYFTNIVNDASLNGLQVAEAQLLGGLAPLPPGILTQPPAAQSVRQGQCLVASAQANGPLPLTYQWYSNSVADPIAGQTNATLSICGVQSSNDAAFAADYFVVVSNAYGSVTSSPVVFTFVPVVTALPSPILPASLGVNIHFVANSTNDIDTIQAAGWKFVRTDFLWGDLIETTKGVYDFTLYDQLFAGLQQQGIRLLGILDNANGLYPGITGANFVAGYSNFCAAAAAHYAGQGIIWEMWNEPNNTWGNADYEDYMYMVEAAVPAIRQADPAAVIISGGCGFDLTWETGCFSMGLENLVDAIAVHPYIGTPEGVISDYASLRSLMSQYSTNSLPVVSSEWGWSDYAGGGVSEQTQGDYLARMYLINLSQGIPLSIWYDWRDDAADITDELDNYGTVTITSVWPKTHYTRETA